VLILDISKVVKFDQTIGISAIGIIENMGGRDCLIAAKKMLPKKDVRPVGGCIMSCHKI
jgi:hypothetical protein